MTWSAVSSWRPRPGPASAQRARRRPAFGRRQAWPVRTGNWSSTRRAQPARAGRAERGPGPVDPGAARQLPEQVRVARSRTRCTSPSRARPRARCSRCGSGRSGSQRLAVPRSPAGAGDELDVGALLVQQRGASPARTGPRRPRRPPGPRTPPGPCAPGRACTRRSGRSASGLGHRGEVLDARWPRPRCGPRHGSPPARLSSKPPRPRGPCR